MRILLTPLLLVTLLVAGCGAQDGDGPDGSGGYPGPPVQVVEETGLVMDTGTPQLCQGPIAESWPPQCAGAELRGWDWADQPAGSYERVGDVRWGEFTLTGGWDGEVFVVSGAQPGLAPRP